MRSKITSKGQVTIPKAVRDFLGVKAGDAVRFFQMPDGHVLILSELPAQALRGVVKAGAHPVPVEEMRWSVAVAGSGKKRG